MRRHLNRGAICPSVPRRFGQLPEVDMWIWWITGYIRTTYYVLHNRRSVRLGGSWSICLDRNDHFDKTTCLDFQTEDGDSTK